MTKYKVGMVLESGAFTSWTGYADDQNHAEGLAQAEQTEQIYRTAYVCTKDDDGFSTLCDGY